MVVPPSFAPRITGEKMSLTRQSVEKHPAWRPVAPYRALCAAVSGIASKLSVGPPCRGGPRMCGTEPPHGTKSGNVHSRRSNHHRKVQFGKLDLPSALSRRTLG
jgi:hypothetical protein